MLNEQDYFQFVKEHFTNISSLIINNSHIRDYCPLCKATMGFTIETIPLQREHMHFLYKMPQPLMLKCPMCNSFKIWIIQNIYVQNSDGEGHIERYRILAIPKNESQIPELPDHPPGLRRAYTEGINCLEANCPTAAAALFKRALHLITRDILGANPGTLTSEFRSLLSKRNKLGMVIHEAFKENSYLIRESSIIKRDGTFDHDILQYTEEDALSLHEMFIELAVMLFVLPRTVQEARNTLSFRKNDII
ncbi:MAG: hypothetical protein RBU23_11650 [Candidatus Auribacterota bacterium]|nr:hypothetical protein [Candidatus Auribacterota bacterium]